MKIYTSREGLKFSISDYPRPADGDVVYFTQREYDYMKHMKLTPEEFRLAWLLKKDNHKALIHPDDINPPKPDPVEPPRQMTIDEICQTQINKFQSKGVQEK